MTTFANEMTIPVELSLKTIDDEICLIQTPVSELEVLNDEEIANFDNIYVCDNEEPIDCGSSAQTKIDVSVNLTQTTASEIKFNLFESGEQVVILSYNFREKTLSLDRTKNSTLTGNIVGRDEKKGFDRIYTVKLNPELYTDKLNLSIFIDSSSIEIFVNDGEYTLNYNVFPDKTPFEHNLYVVNGDVDFNYVKVYTLKSIWQEENVTPPGDIPSDNDNTGKEDNSKTKNNVVTPLLIAGGVLVCICGVVIAVAAKKR